MEVLVLNYLFFRLQPILCDYYLCAIFFGVQNTLEFCLRLACEYLDFLLVFWVLLFTCSFKMKRFHIFLLVKFFWRGTLLSHFAKFCEMFMSNAKPLSKLLMSTLEKSSCLLLEILVTKTYCFKMNRFNNYLFIIHKLLGLKCCHHILQNFMEWW